MKNFVKKLLNLDFAIHALAITAVSLAGIAFFKSDLSSDRAPSSEKPTFELRINRLSTDSTGKLKSLHNAFVRVHFGDKGQEVSEFFKESPLTVKPNESLDLDISIELKDSWIVANKTVFRIDIVEKSFVETVAFRCTTAANALEAYDRSFNCFQPNSESVVLNYRLAKKGSPDPAKATPAVAKK